MRKWLQDNFSDEPWKDILALILFPLFVGACAFIMYHMVIDIKELIAR